MDLRLGTIICQAFDECSNCDSVFKVNKQSQYLLCDIGVLLLSMLQLIDMIGFLTRRSTINNKFQHKYPLLLQMCDHELDTVKRLFDKQLALMDTSSGPMVHKNMPHVAGLLHWSHELRKRCQQMIEKLKLVNYR